MISQEDIDAFMPEQGDPLLEAVHDVANEQHKINSQLAVVQQSIDTIVLVINNMHRDITGMQRDIYALFSQTGDNR